MASVNDLFGGYGAALAVRAPGRKPPRLPYDEMFALAEELVEELLADQAAAQEPATGVRASYSTVQAVFEKLTPDEVRARADSLASSYLAQGVTFDFAGEERPFPLDAIPRVITEAEWAVVESGIKQRVRVLEAFLDDVYGKQESVKAGVIPASVIASAPNYLRQAHGITNPNGVRVHVAGIDLIRDESGCWRVLEDNVRVPSGVSYVISNRQVMAQTLPELFTNVSVRGVDEYPSRLLDALRASAPDGIDDPTVVVLTPGVYNSAYFEHTLLARLMGVELVEGRDLFCSGGYVWMRTTKGPQRVDVIYRRVDDDFLDPLAFRADSVLGAPGLLLAARLGHVSLANGIGNGVADDKLVYTYMPALTRFFLGQEPVLPNVDTWRLDEPDDLAAVIDRLDEVVVKPVDGSGGKGLTVGSLASDEDLAKLRKKLVKNPRGWIAQPIVQLSTIPTLVEDGMRPRHSDLRPFAVNSGDDIWVLPGGLTRVALPQGSLVVNSSQGGGSKDTWVLGGDERPAPRGPVRLTQGRFGVSHQTPPDFSIQRQSDSHAQQQLAVDPDDPARFSQQMQHQQQAAAASSPAAPQRLSQRKGPAAPQRLSQQAGGAPC
jgi:uncharacterized circularly permuted ATP-grasp superfamily protein